MGWAWFDGSWSWSDDVFQPLTGIVTAPLAPFAAGFSAIMPGGPTGGDVLRGYGELWTTGGPSFAERFDAVSQWPQAVGEAAGGTVGGVVQGVVGQIAKNPLVVLGAVVVGAALLRKRR